MNRKEWVVIVVGFAALVLLAFWPEPTTADVPVASTPVPSSAFVPVAAPTVPSASVVPGVSSVRLPRGTRPTPGETPDRIAASMTGTIHLAARQPSSTATPTARAVPPVATVGGTASFVDPAYGPRYLALPGGSGIRVTICGPDSVRHPERCVARTSTDAGPDLERQREGRVADVSYVDAVRLCGCEPWVVGTFPVTVRRLP